MLKKFFDDNRASKLKSRLEREANARTALFSLGECSVWAKCVRCYDGDTVHLVFPLPQDMDGPLYKWACRIDGIDTAEMRAPSGEERAWAVKAQRYVSEKILNKVVKASLCPKREKYGRVLVKIELPDGTDLGTALIKEGLAYAYDGKKKREFSEWSRAPAGALVL